MKTSVRLAGWKLLSVVCFAALFTINTCFAQGCTFCEQVFTNQNQLAGVFGSDTYATPSDPLQNRAWLMYPQFLWADFASLPAQFSEALAESQDQMQGVTVVKLRLTRSLLTGETLVEFPSSTNTLTLAAPANYQTNQVDSASRSSLGLWRLWIAWGEIDANTSPTLSLDLALASVSDKPAYDAALAAEEAESTEASALMSLGGALTMDSEGSENFEVEAASYQTNVCGGVPVSGISGTADGNIRLDWHSLSNLSFYVQSWTNLTEPYPLFTTLATVASQGNQTSYTDAPPSDVKVRFYRILDASVSLPCVTIVTPTDGTTVSGLTNISFYATAIDKIKSTTLIVDGQPAWTITGVKSLPFPSYFFSNGIHTVGVQVTDNGNDGDQGMATSTVSLNVSNNISVTWYEAFGDFLPIQAKLVYSNADYTIQIQDQTSNLVRTITGSTANGIINTNWDGLDGLGNAVPEDALYFLTLTAFSSGTGIASYGPDVTWWGTFKERNWSTAKTILEREVLTSSQQNAFLQGKVDVAIKASFDAAGLVPGSDYFLQHIQNDSDWTTLLHSFTNRNPYITQFYSTMRDMQTERRLVSWRPRLVRGWTRLM